MSAPNSFAQFARLVLSSVRGETRPRAKRQFRAGRLEVFEERITPSITAFPGQVPFIPPGQVVNGQPAQNFSGTFSIVGNPATSNMIRATVTNNNSTAQYVTFAIYTAPGGGQDPTSNAYDNLLSQKVVYSATILVAAHSTVSFDAVDVSTLDLTGQDKFQCDLFASDNPGGYAPDKPTPDSLVDHLIGGELFDFEGK